MKTLYWFAILIMTASTAYSQLLADRPTPSVAPAYQGSSVKLIKPDRSPGIAIGLSFLVPGAGEWYLGGRSTLTHTLVFAAAEVALWTSLIYNHSSGTDREKDFKRFANRNWSEDKYLEFLENALASNPDLQLSPGQLGRKSTGINYDLLIAAEGVWGPSAGVSVHHLHLSGRQQYYEMIYKYPEQFAQGWSDADPDLATGGHSGYTRFTLTKRMTDYRHMRDQSNDYFAAARTMTSLMLVNRVLSMGDVVFLYKRSKSQTSDYRLGLRVEPVLVDRDIRIQPTLRVTF